LKDALYAYTQRRSVTCVCVCTCGVCMYMCVCVCLSIEFVVALTIAVLRSPSPPPRIEHAAYAPQFAQRAVGTGASEATRLDESNKGHRMLQQMGTTSKKGRECACMCACVCERKGNGRKRE
jgi:hypothetical protein